MAPHRTRPASASRPVAIAAAVAAASLLSACFTGERPSFRDEGAQLVSTGNVAVDEVLLRLESVDGSRFTATHRIDTKFGTLTSTATTSQSSGQRRAVTVENDAVSVLFVDDGDDERTCDLRTDQCETGLNDARISNTQLAHTYYAPSFANRLRVSADRRIGDPVASSTTIAGQPAECVDVPVSGGTETYCVLESGVLASFVGADVEILLTAYSPEPDEALFES